jgi:hypothetical protein
MKKVLISDIDPEQRLRSFLRGYTRVPNPEVCRIALTQMPHVWIYTSEGWQKITQSHTPMPKHMSWCQWALTSTLGLDRKAYEKAKKDLFGGGINGVYFRRPDEYALVYKPSRAIAGGREGAGLTAGQWAGVAGGSLGLLALGGLGVNQLLNHNRVPASTEDIPTDLIPGPRMDGYNIKDGITWGDIWTQFTYYETKRTEPLSDDFGVSVEDFDQYSQKVKTFFDNEEKWSRNQPFTYKQFYNAIWPRFEKQINIMKTLCELHEEGVRTGPSVGGYQIKNGTTWDGILNQFGLYEAKQKEPLDENFRVGFKEFETYWDQVLDFFKQERLLSDESVEYQGFYRAQWPRFEQQIKIMEALSKLYDEGVTDERLRELLGPNTSFQYILASTEYQFEGLISEYLKTTDRIDDEMKKKFSVVDHVKKLRRSLSSNQPRLQAVGRFCQEYLKSNENRAYFTKAYLEMLQFYEDNPDIIGQFEACKGA